MTCRGCRTGKIQVAEGGEGERGPWTEKGDGWPGVWGGGGGSEGVGEGRGSSVTAVCGLAGSVCMTRDCGLVRVVLVMKHEQHDSLFVGWLLACLTSQQQTSV